MPELADLLRGPGADLVVDVRTVPRSRANPQFNAATLPEALAAYRIGYRHVRQLGGLRGRRKDQAPSRNAFWENESFRNYADYAATPEFREGMAELRGLGRAHACAVMCAEAVWWQCHRMLLADALVARGIEVRHLLGATSVQPHRLTPFARITNERQVWYPGLV